MALSGEVGELTDLFQWLTPEQAAEAMEDPELAWNVRDELADVMHYLVRLADKLDVDLIEAAFAKIDRNERRFPTGDLRPVALEANQQQHEHDDRGDGEQSGHH
jgi:NTP pyrophosphatase (non-canonical NTP hydrolase)